MKYEDYFVLKKDSIFCAKTACVCDSCFLDITRYCTMGGTNMENILRTMKQGNNELPRINKNQKYKNGENEEKNKNNGKALPKISNNSHKKYNFK